MRTATCLSMLVVSTLSSGALAQDALDVSYDHVHATTLENGLDVVVVENHAVPIVTVEIAARNGAFTEPPEYNGLSHLYEHMFFKANEQIPSQEAYLARQRELGMVWNGTTGDERVNYFFTLQSDRLREGLEFMTAAITTPLFLEEELEREREVVLGEYDRNEASPGYYMWDARDDLLWFEYRSRKDSLGDRETIGTATVEQMRWMQSTYYVPNNALLVLAGDVTPEQGFSLAEEFLGSWERGDDPFVENPVPEHPPLAADVARVVEQPIGVSIIMLSWHGPDTRGDIDATYAADVFSFIAGQQSSAFHQNLVESGVALDASIGYQTLRYVGPISYTLVVQPGGEQAAIEAALAEIERFDDPDYFTDEQIQTAQTLLAVSEIYNQQQTDTLSHTLTYWWATASLDYYLTYVERLAAVTRSEIERYVHTYIHGRPRAAVLTSPENAAAQGIDDDWVLNLSARRGQ